MNLSQFKILTFDVGTLIGQESGMINGLLTDRVDRFKSCEILNARPL